MKIRKMSAFTFASALFLAGCTAAGVESDTLVRELPIEQESAEEVIDETNPETDASESDSLIMEMNKEPQVTVNGDKGTISVGTTGTPFTEILAEAKILLAEEGWDLQIVRYEDYQKLNEDVLNGTVDAHLFAHQTYVDSFNDVNGANLSVADEVICEVYGVYSKINQDLTKLSGAKIAIPTEIPAKGRALLFAQDMGWITLKEKVGITAIVEDVIENPKNLQFVEYERETLEQVLGEADYAIIGADIAIAAGFDMEEDVLQKETSSYESAKAFISLLIATEENVQNDKMTVLSKALNAKEIKTYVEEAYEGAYVLVN